MNARIKLRSKIARGSQTNGTKGTYVKIESQFLPDPQFVARLGMSGSNFGVNLASSSANSSAEDGAEPLAHFA